MTVHDSDLLEPSPFLISDVIHEQIADVIYDQISDVIYDQIPDVIQEQIADAIYDQIPDVIHEQIADVIYEQIPDVIHEQIADTIYEHIPDVIYEQIPDVIHEQIPGILQEDIADVIYDQIPDVIHEQITDVIYDQIADALADKGYCLLTDLLPSEITQSLYQRVSHLTSSDYHAAGIGRQQQFHLNQTIRSDETRWLDEENATDNIYLQWMTELRNKINQRLYMGLFKYEAHYAHYEPGAFYQRHIDAFKGKSNRVLTTLLYLNPNWQESDGGELLIYSPSEDASDEIIERILPTYGKFLVFLSDKFPHEVLRANRDRYSIAGWFHVNNPL